MPELGTYGSVRGAPSDGRPYRDWYQWPAIDTAPAGSRMEPMICQGERRR